MTFRPTANLQDVREFWDGNPLASSAIDAAPGSPEFFAQYDLLREVNETREFAKSLHEYDRFNGKRVLEVGCGNAYTLARYAEHGAEVWGIDVSTEALKISQNRFRLKGLRGTFCQGNGEALPFTSDFFDCICSMGVLHHIPDTEQAVDEIYRCLKPGGRLIVMMYHRNSIAYRIGFPLICLTQKKSLQQVVNEVDGIGNPKGDVYSRKELKKLFGRFTGLETFKRLYRPWMLPRFDRLIPAWIRPWLGRHFGWFIYLQGYK